MNPISPQAAWSQVLDYMKEAGEEISKRTQGDPIAEAEGCRFLSRLFSSMRLFLLEQNPMRPDFVPVMTPARKFFADNPDTLYHRAPLRDDLTYRVTGLRGTCAYLSFCVYAIVDGRTQIVSDLSDKDLKTNDDGSFEIELSPERNSDASNWMKLDTGVRSLVTRQYYLDRDREQPADYAIECLNHPANPVVLSPETAALPLQLLHGTLQRAVKATLDASDAWSREPNTISFDSDAGGLADLFPTPDNQYTGGWFDLAENDALLLTLQPPDCRYWNVHLLTPWLESLDAWCGVSCLNVAQAVPESDGSVKLTIAHRDPGTPNWLDTGGRRTGCFAFRWLQAGTLPPPPKCELRSLV